MCRYQPMSEDEYRITLMNRRDALTRAYGNPGNPEVKRELKFISRTLIKLTENKRLYGFLK